MKFLTALHAVYQIYALEEKDIWFVPILNAQKFSANIAFASLARLLPMELLSISNLANITTLEILEKLICRSNALSVRDIRRNANSHNSNNRLIMILGYF
jgi:hypothetical protein